MQKMFITFNNLKCFLKPNKIAITQIKKEEDHMFDKKELCQKIIELYPDLGACEIDVDAFYSTAKGTWVVELKKGDHILQHHLEKHDALDCIDGKQCVSLGIEIAQLKKNIETK
jgi:hypothetical protein